MRNKIMNRHKTSDVQEQDQAELLVQRGVADSPFDNENCVATMTDQQQARHECFATSS